MTTMGASRFRKALECLGMAFPALVILLAAAWTRPVPAQGTAARVIKFEPNQVTLAPGQSRTVTIRGVNLLKIERMTVRTGTKSVYSEVDVETASSHDTDSMRRIVLKASSVARSGRYYLYFESEGQLRMSTLRLEVAAPGRPQGDYYPVQKPTPFAPSIPAPEAPPVRPGAFIPYPATPRYEPPQVVDYQPKKRGYVGKEIQIWGYGFKPDRLDAWVGAYHLPRVSASETLYIASLPDFMSGDLVVSYGSPETTLILERNYQVVGEPQIQRVMPEYFSPGVEVSVQGVGLTESALGRADLSAPVMPMLQHDASTTSLLALTEYVKIGTVLFSVSDVKRGMKEIRFRIGEPLNPGTLQPLSPVPPEVAGRLYLPRSTFGARLFYSPQGPRAFLTDYTIASPAMVTWTQSSSAQQSLEQPPSAQPVSAQPSAVPSQP